MTIDWGMVFNVGWPVALLVIGALVNHLFESRPILITYYGHISSFQINPPNQNPTAMHTHSVVVRNTGRKKATNLRLHHRNLPDFDIYPTVAYTTEALPNGSTDIVIPSMPPGKEVTVSYLYFPPTVYADINDGIESDEGLAKQIPVLLQRIFPNWFNRLALLLMLVGLIAVGYLILQSVRYFL